MYYSCRLAWMNIEKPENYTMARVCRGEGTCYVACASYLQKIPNLPLLNFSGNTIKSTYKGAYHSRMSVGIKSWLEGKDKSVESHCEPEADVCNSARETDMP
jgi:hypothetical protein